MTRGLHQLRADATAAQCACVDGISVSLATFMSSFRHRVQHYHACSEAEPRRFDCLAARLF